MDRKQTRLLAELHADVVAGNFRERDVIALFSLLREEAPKGGVVREFGDFVAGHRVRDRGPVYEYVEEIKRAADTGAPLCVRPVFSEAEIAAALNDALTAQGLAPLSQNRHRQLQVACISTLQNASMEYQGARIADTRVRFIPDEVQLTAVIRLEVRPDVGISFPVLGVSNDCIPISTRNAHVRAGELLRVEIKDGVTTLGGLD